MTRPPPRPVEPHRAACGVVVAAALLAACAYRPPVEVLSGARCMPPEAVRAQSAAAAATATTALGWALPLAAAGAATLPAGAALGTMDPWERGAAIAAPLGTLATAAGLLVAWALADQAAAQWSSGLGCVPGDARSPWEALELPDPGEACTGRDCP